MEIKKKIMEALEFADNNHDDSKINQIFSKEINALGIRQYNVEKIINSLKVKDGHNLVNYVGYVLSEKRKDVIKRAYNELGKEMLLAFLEKTMTIENEGGLEKAQNNNNEKKSPGGIFFKLVKNGISKETAKKIFVKNYKDRNERKKLMRKIENLLI